MARVFIGLQFMFAAIFCLAQEPSAGEIFGNHGGELKAWAVADIVWDEVYADGSRLAILEGPRNIPGQAFTYAFFLPDGVMVGGHWHCAEARVFVAMGTMLLGLGNQASTQNTTEYPTGSYLIVPHRVAHYEAAKGDVVIFGTGHGPWCTVDTE